MCTAWLVLTGTQVITNVSDMARFGATIFNIIAPLQLAMVLFLSAITAASAVALEKDKKTLILLLLTRLNNSELVLGRLLSSMLQIFVMLLAGLPIFAWISLFGGISFAQIGNVFVTTAVSALAAGSLGSTIALWREKTFQTLALTAMAVLFWLLIGEVVAANLFGESIAGVPSKELAIWVSPLRAVLNAAEPFRVSTTFASGFWVFLGVATGLAFLLNAIAIWKCRIWNPSREIRRKASPAEEKSIWEETGESESVAEKARTQHVDAKLRKQKAARYRKVWENPILWREICTWAYGKKIVAIRLVYLLFAIATGVGIYLTVGQDGPLAAQGAVLPSFAKPILPLCVLSLVMINALSVTTITTERDGRSLDLLLVTDLSPAEFLFGKLGGVFWIAKEMILFPLAICVALYWRGILDFEAFLFTFLGLSVLNVFVAVLGIHCGMNYSNSRSAVSVSLGTVFFLFLGIATCIIMMISFSGSFNLQLYPFLAFILGGGVGLYVSLGARNPSPAILLASISLPFATFYAIVSYFMGLPLAVFLVTTISYGFTATAMMIPALTEFDFAMGKNMSTDE